MTEQVRAGGVLLARRRELGPPCGNRAVQVTGARLGEAQRGHRGDGLRAGKRQARRVSLPSPAGPLVSVPRPQIHPDVVALADAQGGARLLATLEVPGEDGGDAAEPRIAVAANRGLQGSTPSGNAWPAPPGRISLAKVRGPARSRPGAPQHVLA